MEDLELPPGSPVLQNGEEPQGNDDPADPLQPGIDEEDAAPTPPAGNPTADTEVDEDAAAPAANSDDDLESELDELDDERFADFDPSTLNLPDKPVQVDSENVGLLGVHKRKRTAEEEEERRKNKKKKEGRREKVSKRKKRGEDVDDDDFMGGEEIDGKRVRKSKVGADGRVVKSAGAKRAREVERENEEELTPEERKFCLHHPFLLSIWS